MRTNEITREQISVLADGELTDQHLDVALAALRQNDALADWEIYHQIGDVLRSDDMALGLSAGFAARMAARLEAEPIIVAPATSNDRLTVSLPSPETRTRHPAKRWAIPGMAAAAAMAVVAFVATPQLMVAMKGEPASSDAARVALTEVESTANTASSASTVSASATEGLVLRDPRIDDYLLAHQRFSPSLYSAAQYARSATFATDSSK